jgi:hypothetical protein
VIQDMSRFLAQGNDLKYGKYVASSETAIESVMEKPQMKRQYIEKDCSVEDHRYKRRSCEEGTGSSDWARLC